MKRENENVEGGKEEKTEKKKEKELQAQAYGKKKKRTLCLRREEYNKGGTVSKIVLATEKWNGRSKKRGRNQRSKRDQIFYQREENMREEELSVHEENILERSWNAALVGGSAASAATSSCSGENSRKDKIKNAAAKSAVAPVPILLDSGKMKKKASAV